MAYEHYRSLLAELSSLRDDFASFANRHTFLEHDLIWGPDCGIWDEAEFKSFSSDHQQQRSADWQEWTLWPSRRACGRYWSFSRSAKGMIGKFEQLAERGFDLLKELHRLEVEGGSLPEEVRFPKSNSLWIVSDDTGAQMWLRLVHEWAIRFPTTRLKGNCRWWNYNGPSEADPADVEDKMTSPASGGLLYHSHPVCNTMNYDVFAASEEFLRACLAPEETIPIGIHDGPIPDISLPSPRVTPIWVTEPGELWYCNMLIKQLSSRAENQRKVLDIFEEKGWNETIQNPFNDRPDPQKKMDDTVTELNKDHVTKDKLHFGIVNKKEVYWELINES